MNFSISYNIGGKGDTIVFIHGIGSRKYSWNCVIKILKNKFRCISYDFRGTSSTESSFLSRVSIELLRDLEMSYKEISQIEQSNIYGTNSRAGQGKNEWSSDRWEKKSGW